MKKKIISLVLAAIMSLGFAIPAMAQEDTFTLRGSFAEITITHVTKVLNYVSGVDNYGVWITPQATLTISIIDEEFHREWFRGMWDTVGGEGNTAGIVGSWRGLPVNEPISLANIFAETEDAFRFKGYEGVPEIINTVNSRIQIEGAGSVLLILDETAAPQQPTARTLRFAIDSVTFTDNGTAHTLDAAPFIADGRTMVPLRNIIEAFGVEPQFNDGVITFTIGGTLHTMTIGQPLPDNMGTPVIVAARTFVPLIFVINALDGADARWDGDARAAYVYID